MYEVISSAKNELIRIRSVIPVVQHSDLQTFLRVLKGILAGPDFIRNINREIPEIGLVTSCGIRISENRWQRWFDEGALCIRLDEALVVKDVIAVKDWSKLETALFGMVHAIQQIKAWIRKPTSGILL